LGTEDHAVHVAIAANQRGPRQDDDARGFSSARERLDELFRVDDAGLWRKQRSGGTDAGLARCDERAIDAREFFDAVGGGARMQRVERGYLGVVGGDDELAAAR